MHDILLDGRKIGNLGQLHTVLKEALELPDYYGNNLDALWDCLTGYVAMPLTIRWVHFQESEKSLGIIAGFYFSFFGMQKKNWKVFNCCLNKD
nr:barstar family protein [Paenibacillus larvae]